MWAIFSTLDPRVLQFKPGILLGPELCRGAARPDRRRDRAGRRRGPGRPRRWAPVSGPVVTGPAGQCGRAGGHDAASARDWAAAAFAAYDRERTLRIVEAVAEAAYQNAERYAEWAVEETGMGVAEHKRLKNEACSRGVLERYRGRGLRRARGSTPAAKIVAVPRPAGVVLALTPSTNPVATVYFKVDAGADDAQRGRRQPAPAGAKECCADAVRHARRARPSRRARPTAACRWSRSRPSR